MEKSTLRTLFIVGVVASSVAFIALTINTLAQMPARTNEQNLTSQVVAGKQAWQRHDCVDCHTLLGNGAYFAPDLTVVAKTRGAAFIHAWLAAPAGQMPNQRLTGEEVADLAAFFAWVSEIDTNGWPPQPLTNALAGQGGTTYGASLFDGEGCAGCHGAGGQGTAAAPSLVGVTERMDAATLAAWLKDPAAVKPDAKMPNLNLAAVEIETLIEHLGTLK